MASNANPAMWVTVACNRRELLLNESGFVVDLLVAIRLVLQWNGAA